MKVGMVWGVFIVATVGCTTAQSTMSVQSTQVAAPVVRTECKFPPLPTKHSALTEHQERVLREFSLAVAPQLWQAIQMLRGEIDSRGKTMQQLADDLREFDRKPEDDADYCNLQIGREKIACTLDNVYQKLEDAYIAYKKYQATPSKQEYSDAMRRALEDGILEAEATARRYRVMSIGK